MRRSPGPSAPPLEIPAFDGGGRIDEPSLPNLEDFLAVDDDMRAYARNVLAPIANTRERVRRLAADLLATGGPLGIRYDESRTLTAREVFHLKQGNCLSFTALTVLLAREAGLEAHFQDVPVLPQWHLSGGTFVVERHVDALIPLGSLNAVIDFRPPDAATYSTARVIEDANATAQYFGNLGVDRFTAGDLEGAYRLYRRGLQADPRASTLWLNLGVVLARNGQPADAERAYRAALSIAPGDLSALNNLAVMLEQVGDAAGRSAAARESRALPTAESLLSLLAGRAGAAVRSRVGRRRAVRGSRAPHAEGSGLPLRAGPQLAGRGPPDRSRAEFRRRAALGPDGDDPGAISRAIRVVARPDLAAVNRCDPRGQPCVASGVAARRLC